MNLNASDILSLSMYNLRIPTVHVSMCFCLSTIWCKFFQTIQTEIPMSNTYVYTIFFIFGATLSPGGQKFRKSPVMRKATCLISLGTRSCQCTSFRNHELKLRIVAVCLLSLQFLFQFHMVSLSWYWWRNDNEDDANDDDQEELVGFLACLQTERMKCSTHIDLHCDIPCDIHCDIHGQIGYLWFKPSNNRV